MPRPLRVVMAVSADGFVSRDPDDDMSWTGEDDKRVFRLLTHVGGLLGAGSRTFGLMPRLGGRRVMCLSRSGRPGTLSLHEFAGLRGAWLIGGQETVMEAIDHDYVEELFLCQAMATCLGSGQREEMSARMQFGPRTVAQVGNCHVQLYRRSKP